MSGLPYNGWPKLVRCGRDPHYNRAKKAGILSQLLKCLGCGQLASEAGLSYHAEEYGPSVEDYLASCKPICNRCHAMVHARCATPNRWKEYLRQVSSGTIDESQFPSGPYYLGLHSAFLNRKETSPVTPISEWPGYLGTLPSFDYAGPDKRATLRVVDLSNGLTVEVPDWTLYGAQLQKLSVTERVSLEERGIRVEAFLTGAIKLPTNSAGVPRYKRLYPPFDPPRMCSPKSVL